MKNVNKTLLAGTVSAILMSGASVADEEQSWSGQAKDAWLDGKAEMTLMMNEDLDSFDIDTDVEQGVLTLTGTVATEEQREMAEDVTENVDGIEDVVNNLQVADASSSESSDEGAEYGIDKTSTPSMDEELMDSEQPDTDTGSHEYEQQSSNIDSEAKQMRRILVAYA